MNSPKLTALSLASSATPDVEKYCEEHGYPLSWAEDNGSVAENVSVSVPLGRRTERGKVEYLRLTVSALTHHPAPPAAPRSRLLYSERDLESIKSAKEGLIKPEVEVPRFNQGKGTGCGAYWGQTAAVAMKATEKDVSVSWMVFEAESNWLTMTYILAQQGLTPPYENAGGESAIVPVAIGGASSFPVNNVEDVEFAKRRVFVVPDRDDASSEDGLKDSVRLGWSHTAKAFAALGADVFVCYIHHTPVGRANAGLPKIGHDDYFRLGGTLSDLLKTAVRPCEGTVPLDPLQHLVANWAYDVKNTSVVNRKDPTLIKPLDKWRNDVATIGHVIAGKRVPASADYINGIGCIRPDIMEKDWMPNKPTGTIVARTLNTWTGLDVLKWKDAKRDGKTWRMFKRHVLAMCGGNPEYRDLVLTYIAHAFLKPTKRPDWWWFIYSELTGVGKTALGDIICRVIGKIHSVTDLDKKAFSGDFEGKEQSNKLFMNIGDVSVNGNRHDTNEWFQQKVTLNRLSINDKGISRYDEPNYMRVLYSMNKPLIGLNVDERRAFVTDVQIPADVGISAELRALYPDESDYQLSVRAYSAEFRSWASAPLGGDRAALLDIYEGLMDEYAVAAEAFDPRERPPRTDAFLSLVSDGKSATSSKSAPIIKRITERYESGEALAYSEDSIKEWLASRDDIEKNSLSVVALEIKSHIKKVLNKGNRIPSKNVGGTRISVIGKNITVEVGTVRDAILAENKDILDWMIKTGTCISSRY